MKKLFTVKIVKAQIKRGVWLKQVENRVRKLCYDRVYENFSLHWEIERRAQELRISLYRTGFLADESDRLIEGLVLERLETALKPVKEYEILDWNY